MKPEKTMTIPMPLYRDDERYYDNEGTEYYFTDVRYSLADEGWQYYDRYHDRVFTEAELNEWIGEKERQRVHSEADRWMANLQRKIMENKNRLQILKGALK